MVTQRAQAHTQLFTIVALCTQHTTTSSCPSPSSRALASIAHRRQPHYYMYVYLPCFCAVCDILHFCLHRRTYTSLNDSQSSLNNTCIVVLFVSAHMYLHSFLHNEQVMSCTWLWYCNVYNRVIYI